MVNLIFQNYLPFIFILLITFAIFFIQIQIEKRLVSKWRNLNEAEKEPAIPDTLFRLRKIGFYASIFYLGLMIASVPILIKSKPMWLFWICLVTIFFAMIFSGFLSSLLEKEVRSATANKLTYLRAILYGLSFCVTAQVIMYGSFWAWGSIAEIAYSVSPWEPIYPKITAGALWVIKLFTGFFAISCLTPSLMKFSLQLKKVTDSGALDTIRSAFAKSSLKTPEIWILPFDEMKRFNVMIWRNPFLGHHSRPLVIFSERLATTLTKKEIEAIMFHEISHLELNHISKRFWAIALTIVYLILLKVFLLSVALTYWATIGFWLIMAFPILTIAGQIIILSRIVRVQELQADAYSVFHFGAEPADMKSSLEKLYKMNDMLSNKRDPSTYLSPSSAHPTLEFRCQSIDYVKERLKKGEPMFQWMDYFRGNLHENTTPGARMLAGITFASCLLLVGFLPFSMLFNSSNAYSLNFAKCDLRSVDRHDENGIDYFESDSGLNGRSPEVLAWINALEKRDIGTVEKLSMTKNSTALLKNEIWGKAIFFTATDSTPEVLDAYLRHVKVPNDFVEHSLPRLASQRNCRAYRRLVKYARDNNQAIRDIASAGCGSR